MSECSITETFTFVKVPVLTGILISKLKSSFFSKAQHKIIS